MAKATRKGTSKTRSGRQRKPSQPEISAPDWVIKIARSVPDWVIETGRSFVDPKQNPIEPGVLEPGVLGAKVAQLQAEALATALARKQAAPQSRKKRDTKENRVLNLLVELGDRVRPGLQPHEVEKIVLPIYRQRFSAEVSRTVIVRAYNAHIKAHIATDTPPRK